MDGSEETFWRLLWAVFFTFSAAVTSGALKTLLGGNSLERSMALLVSLAATVRASFLHCRRTEKEIGEAGFLKLFWIFCSLGESRLL